MTEREAAEHMAVTIEKAVAKWIEGKLDAHDHHDLQMAVAQYRVVRSVLDSLTAPTPARKYTGRQCDRCRGSGWLAPPGNRPDMDGSHCDICTGTGRMP